MSNRYPAPAKINRHLRVIKKRDDGYHEIETSFQFLDFADELNFEITNDGIIQRIDNHDFTLPEDDLIIQAAKLLQPPDSSKGVTITLTKKIPPGSGLGGGSSNAATTLIALEWLWRLRLQPIQLTQLGLQLGADVPMFLHGRSARATGIGEVFGSSQPPPLETWVCVFLPPVTVSTKEIFSHWGGQTSPTKNDLEPITAALYPEVAAALTEIRKHTNAEMSGSGSAIFAECVSHTEAEKLITKIKTPGIVTHSRNHHLLANYPP